MSDINGYVFRKILKRCTLQQKKKRFLLNVSLKGQQLPANHGVNRPSLPDRLLGKNLCL